mgnify:CR=1 FL=1
MSQTRLLENENDSNTYLNCLGIKKCTAENLLYNFKQSFTLFLLFCSIGFPLIIFGFEIYIMLQNYSTLYKCLNVASGYLVITSMHTLPSVILIFEIKKFWPVVLLFSIHNISQILLVFKVFFYN